MNSNETSFLLYGLSQPVKIQTTFGKRSLYNSVSFCNRCGSCSQACPVYRLNMLETDSPRGRNQAIRLSLERKLKVTEPELQRSFAACTLCGSCSQLCAARLPTAHHVLTVQRTLHARKLPFGFYTLLALRGNHPSLFEKIVWVGLRLRPLWRLGAYGFGIKGLQGVYERLPKKIISLKNAFQNARIAAHEKTPQFIYLPSLEAEFLQPQIAVSSLRLISRRGKTTCWRNTACGLFEYVYGDLRQSKRLLRRLIRKHLQLEQGNLPLVTDSLDMYHFLKQAEQLFAPYEQAAEQARRFAEKVQFITEFFPPDLKISSDVKLPVRLDLGALFCRQSDPQIQSISLFKTLFKQNFVECEYTDFDTPAFGYAFSAGNQNEPLMLQVVKQIARKQIKTVFTFSGLCALELNHALRRFYPAAEAQHIVSVADKL